MPRPNIARCVPFLLLAAIHAPLAAQEGAAGLQPVPFPRVRIDDPFFASRRATNTKVTLEHALRQLEETGTLGNFDLAAAGKHDGFKGYVFQDSDAFKALEAIGFALAETRDPVLEAKFDAVVARIAAAQRPDGYLNSAYTVQPRERGRFSNLRDDHELYCAGHLFEAAAAHFEATGKRNLLDVAVKYADLLVRTFGEGEGRRAGYCGHPEIELALVKLGHAANDPNYFDLARHFVRTRGSRFFATEDPGKRQDPATWDGRYWLDHVPVLQMQGIAGHAVRAAYLMAGATDVAAANGEADLLAAVRRIWRNTIEKNVFVTGGIGPSASNEGFTEDYDLPTHTAYQESCASIAVAMWAHRLNLVTMDPAYADAVETALYNAIPAGVQLDGTKFFYVNPLASRGTHHRRAWFGCACCPPNLARTFAALGSYAYATGPDALYVNLYLRGDLQTQVAGEKHGLVVETAYPWHGEVALRFVEAPSRAMTLNLRVPGWCETATVQVGDDAPLPSKAGYAALHRTWRRGDVVKLSLPMPVRTLLADPRAEALRGRVAFARGPIVYCVEQVDQAVPVEELVAAPGTVLAAQERQDLLGGVTVLTGAMLHCKTEPWTGQKLYRPAPTPVAVPVTLVPYAVWDNRAAGAMAVWLPQAPALPRLGGPELTAKIEVSFRNGNSDPEGLRDGAEPKRSGETPPRNCHFWDHSGGTEWAQYSWDTPQRLAGCRIYWFDDTGHGACRLPKAARLLWRDGEQWRPVVLQGGAAVPLATDRWCDVTFAPIATTALRLELDQQDKASSGVLEWRLIAAED
ncbi:MAG: glycoside hydrolase family 127 protein [Planctomycetota bacterium]|nr:glycoside hydrolase family 127 protein [Planctomycetota bacterium]